MDRRFILGRGPYVFCGARPGDLDAARAELPAERVYPLSALIRSMIGATEPSVQ